MGLIDDIKDKYQKGNLAIRLIFINVAIFVILHLISSFGKAFLLDFYPTEIFGLNPDISDNLYRPWSIFTYMFLHFNLWHLLTNMLMLYFFGKFFFNYFNNKAFAQFYFIGGIVGGIVFLLFNLITNFNGNMLIGASAATYSVLFAMVAYQPDLKTRLPFINEPIKLSYLAIGFIVLGFLINNYNIAGNISHVGGSLFGYFYMKQFEKGKSWFEGIKNPFKRIKPKLKAKKNTNYQKPPKDDYEYADWKKKKENDTNKILEKISRSGYNSLTKEEKEFLFNQGKK